MDSLSDDIEKLVGDSILISSGKIIVLGGSFVGHTLLIRTFKPNVFGQLSLALTIISVCAGLAAIGMNQAVPRFIAGSNLHEAGEYATIGVSGTIAGGLALSVAVYMLRGHIESFFEVPGLSNFLRLLTMLIILRPLSQVILGIARGFEMTRWKVVSGDLLPLFLSFPILIYLIHEGEIILAVIGYYFSKPVIRILALLLNFSREDRWEYSFDIPDRETIIEVFSFSWPLAIESLVVVFLGSIDILMIGWLATSSEVGVYRSIQPVAQTLIFMLQALTFIYLPIAARYFDQNDLSNLDSMYKASTRWVSQATFPLFLFYLLFGRSFIHVFFGNEYTVAATSLALLSIGMYSRVFAGPNGMMIKAINRTQEDLLASVGALSTNVVLNYLLIPPYGINGAAVATTLGYFVYNTIDLVVIYNYVSVSPFHRDLVAPLFPTVVVVLLANYFVAIPSNSILALVFIGGGISIVHALSIAVTTGLTYEDRVLINQIRKDN